MARRKQSEDLEPAPADALDDGTFAPSVEELGPLAEEVRSFMDRRDELARKLAEEIEATEKKLAELRRTAAALFPESSEEEEPERPERKPKKAAKTVKLSQESCTPSSPREESPADAPAEPTPAQEAPAGEPAAESVPTSDGPIAQVA